MDRLDPSGDPRTDRVGPAGQIVRVVRVQTLHPRPGAPNAAPILGFGNDLSPLLRVLSMRRLKLFSELLVRFRPLRKPLDPTRALQPGDGLHRIGAGEPVQSWERPALTVQRMIANDEGVTTGAASHNAEFSERLTAELCGDLCQVCPPELGVASGACARRIAGNR